MTKPVVPKGQEIDDILRRLAAASYTTNYEIADIEEKIREIIAQEIEDALFGDPKTLLDLGVWAPITGSSFPTVSDGVMGAANIVRGKTPVTQEQWTGAIGQAQDRRRVRQSYTGPSSRHIRGPEDHA